MLTENHAFSIPTDVINAEKFEFKNPAIMEENNVNKQNNFQ